MSSSVQTALDLLKKEQQSEEDALCKFCHSFDDLLGGVGVPMGTLTEIAGESGIGKTQLCMQLCASVQLPRTWGGAAGQAIYIDTEGSFHTDRFSQIVHGTIKHFTEISENKVTHHTAEEMLKSTYIVRCRDHIELSGAVFKLMNFIKSHQLVKLVVIDSLAFHLRHMLESGQDRNMLLANIATELIKVAYRHNVAIVVTNQMTTRFEGDVGSVAVALGHSWAHIPTSRLLMHKETSTSDQSHRVITLIKSPCLPNATAEFKITADGIRDV